MNTKLTNYQAYILCRKDSDFLISPLEILAYGKAAMKDSMVKQAKPPSPYHALCEQNVITAYCEAHNC